MTAQLGCDLPKWWAEDVNEHPIMYGPRREPEMTRIKITENNRPTTEDFKHV